MQSASEIPVLQEIAPVASTDSAQLAVVDDNGRTDRTFEIEDLDLTNEAPPYVNSVDATVGQPIVTRVLARKHELEAALATLAVEETRERGDLELALSTIGELLTGDLEHVPAVVALNMSRWLEASKHLAESAVAVSEPVTTPMDVAVPRDAAANA